MFYKTNCCVTTSVTLMYFYKVVYLFQSFLVITVYPLSCPPSPFYIINLFPPSPFFINYLFNLFLSISFIFFSFPFLYLLSFPPSPFYVLYLFQLPLLYPLYFITFPFYNLYILWSSPSISFIFFHLTLTRSF